MSETPFVAAEAGTRRRGPEDHQLRALVDTARDAFVSIDDAGTITEWNRQAEELFGWTRPEAMGALLADLIVPAELRDAHLMGIRRFLATGTGTAVFQRLQLPALHRSGRRLLVEFTIWPSRTETGSWRFHAFLHDVAAEHRAERYLKLVQQVAVAANDARTVEEAVRATLDAVRSATSLALGHAYLWSEDRQELLPTGWWSPAPREPLAEASAARTFRSGEGLPGRVVASRHAEWIRDVRDDPNFPRQDHAVRSGVRAAFAFPVTVGVDVVAVLEVFAGDPSEPDPHLLEVMESVGTQLGRVFERLWALDELRAAAEEREAIVSIVSHELRGPLAAAHSATSLLQAPLAEDPDNGELIQLVDRQLGRLRRLVDDLLTAQRLDHGGTNPRRHRVELADVVEQVVSTLGLPDVDVDVPSGVQAAADPDHVEQMVWNLVTNAAAHGRPPIGVAVARTDGSVQLRVSDAGAGVPPELVPRLFERFARGSASAGTGLGLSIVHGLAEANGGALSYEPEPGPTFVVTLPAW